MRRISKQPYFSKSWIIALVIRLIFVAVGYGVRFAMEDAGPTQDRSWPDLALFLCGYLCFFCLQPIQTAIHRKLRRRAFRNTHEKTSS